MTHLVPNSMPKCNRWIWSSFSSEQTNCERMKCDSYKENSTASKIFHELLLLMTLCFPIHLAFSLSFCADGIVTANQPTQCVFILFGNGKYLCWWWCQSEQQNAIFRWLFSHILCNFFDCSSLLAWCLCVFSVFFDCSSGFVAK